MSPSSCKSSGNGEPSPLEVPTSIDNEAFNLENIIISYQSSDTDVINFVQSDSGLIMHVTPADVEVQVTLSASYKTYSYSKVLDITVSKPEISEDYLTVNEAIEADDGEEITVKGIVASGTVNQAGFYLVDETGIIAIRTDSETLKKISLGNEVYMKGTRTHVVKDGSSNVGQSCIDKAELVLNNYGQHDYSKESFVTDMSLTDLLAYKNSQASVDLTAKAYVVKGHITKVASNYSTNYYVSTSSTYSAASSYYLYAGSGGQYAPFDEFVGAGEVTIELALCDWNTKSEYRACLISVSDSTHTVVNNYNFR